MIENTPITPLTLGNTKPMSKRSPETKSYCFTLNNYSDLELNNIIEILKKEGAQYIIGKEIGAQNTPHLQGYFKLKVKKPFDRIMRLLNNKRIHLEKCKGTTSQNELYCTKDMNFVSNYYKAPEKLELLPNLKEWMREIETILLEKANNRAVYWLWEPEGGVGKSSFAKYLCHSYEAIFIDEGKKSDLMNVLFNIKRIDSKSIIVFDIPRNNGNAISYKAIESIKNGLILNTKYETGMKIFNSPHVLIFSNFYPNINELSLDRWRIGEIKTNKIIWEVLIPPEPTR